MNTKAKLVIADDQITKGRANAITHQMSAVGHMAAWVDQRFYELMAAQSEKDEESWHAFRVTALTIDLTAIVKMETTRYMRKEDPALEIVLTKQRAAFRWWHLKKEY